MVSLFLLLGCNLSYIVDLFAGLHELASASACTLLKLASSVRALLKPYWATLKTCQILSLMAAAEDLVAEFSSFANSEERKRKSNLLMSFLKISNQMGSFGQIRKKNRYSASVGRFSIFSDRIYALNFACSEFSTVLTRILLRSNRRSSPNRSLPRPRCYFLRLL